MSTEFKSNEERIIEKIKNKAPDFRCPACSQNDFNLVGGYFTHDLQDDLNQRSIGGKNVPTVPIVCKNCGYILEFAAGVLELLPERASSERGAQITGKD